MIYWIENKMPKNEDLNITEYFNKEIVDGVRKYHESVPGYKKTELCRLDSLAEYLGIKKIYVKDESSRYGLNAFKILGAGYAIGKYLAEELGRDINTLSFEALKAENTKNIIGERIFYSATDGNHGRAVAWFAGLLGYKACIYMPKGSSEVRLNNIRSTGAYAEITEFNYDDAVRYVSKLAEKNKGIVIQDTAWKGYEKIPVWIMQGYSMLALEAMNELTEVPTHVFLQAGVGSFASAVEGYFVSRYGKSAPKFLVFESDQADCYYKSAVAGDGKARFAKGDMQTLMAGLACGEPNTVSFEIIKNNTSVFASCSDDVAALGMRMYGNPLNEDKKIISGESGAGTLGLLYYILKDESYEELKKKLSIDKNSRVLLISSEGNTDPERYLDVVWKGRNRL